MSIDKIGVIGAGNMGGAFVRGWLKADPSMAGRIAVSDAVEFAAERLSRDTGVAKAAGNTELVEQSDLVLLAVKPADVESALAGTLKQFGRGKILVSCVAGRTTASLEVLFPVDVAVARVMPNVAVEVGAGTISFASGSNVDLETEERIIEIFNPLGHVIVLQEKLFAAATAIGGSGPGFLAVIAEAFIDAGVMAGLSSASARELTYSMMAGTSRLLQEAGLSPSELRHKVTSPAGTTAAGIAQLERDGTRSAIIDAVQVTVKRANELG
jgi:pyrroline-5-carboxylate reductase